MPLYFGNSLISGKERIADSSPVKDSKNLITSGGVYNALQQTSANISRQSMPDINVSDKTKKQIEINKANIDYISMMFGIILIDTKDKNKINLIKEYYENNYWDKQMVLNAINRWITQDEADNIINR